MPSSAKTYDAEQLRALLVRVGSLAAERGVVLELVALGGAAIALLFESRRTTRDDIDRADAVVVAAALGLDRSSAELAMAPYLRPERYTRACEELADIWQEVEDAHR